MKRFIAAALLLTCAPDASANDSSAAIGLGGLELTRNEAISMDSEDLFISRELVTVKYRFTNRSAKDVETLISFPLPSIPYGISEYLGDQNYPDWNDLQFTTLVDGKPAKLTRVDKVEVNGRDVSVRLRQLGWPVDYWANYEFMEGMVEWPEAKKAAGLKEGLLRQADYDPKAVEPSWQVTAYITRKQIFPAGKTVAVEHSYRPVVGGSVGGMLTPDNRKGQNEYYMDYLQRYCLDRPFLAAFDKIHAAKLKAAKKKGSDYDSVPYIEHWVGYVLKSGANWRGPIKDFRLVIDKGKPENLLSFCGSGVKKISPTRFEMRKTNFEPTADLNLLIVEFSPFEGG